MLGARGGGGGVGRGGGIPDPRRHRPDRNDLPPALYVNAESATHQSIAQH